MGIYFYGLMQKVRELGSRSWSWSWSLAKASIASCSVPFVVERGTNRWRGYCSSSGDCQGWGGLDRCRIVGKHPIGNQKQSRESDHSIQWLQVKSTLTWYCITLYIYTCIHWFVCVGWSSWWSESSSRLSKTLSVNINIGKQHEMNSKL